MSDPESNRNPGRFATTRWSVVGDAGNETSDKSQKALRELCTLYWLPLYVFAKRKTASIDEAQDLTQAFFLDLLTNNLFASAEPKRGRFRSYLLTAFRNFMSKQWAKQKALKRGGGKAPISLDFTKADSDVGLDPPDSGLTPEQIFDQQWAIRILNSTLEQLETDQIESGNEERYALLKNYVIGDHSGPSYAELAQRLETTEGAVKKAVSRLRIRFKGILREEIAHTVSHEDEIDDEIRRLFDVFGKN